VNEQSRAGAPKPGEKTTEQRIADLELQLASVKATTPLGTIPDHGGGVGQEIEDTWSQQDQELAWAGEHPLQGYEEPTQRPPGVPPGKP
jgi:hypothetical protein